jgi:hypothetical protein
LEEIYFGENGLFENSPLRPLRGAAPMVKALAVSPPAVELSADEDQHYVGRLR